MTTRDPHHLHRLDRSDRHERDAERARRLGTVHAHTTLTAALAYAERGWHVFPLAVGQKRPTITDWPNAASTDPALIREWFAPVLSRPFGLGIACGPSGLVVLDLDHKPEQGITAREGWARLRALGDLPRTRTVRTPSGGWHLYYAAPEGVQLRNTAGRLGRGIDTRAAGGYVAAPPTRLANGGYEFTSDADPAPGTLGGLAMLPTWLSHALSVPPSPPAPPAPAITEPTTAAGSRRVRAYLDAAVRAETARVRDATPGTRNDSLLIAAIALGQLAAGGALTEDTVHALLLDAAAGHLTDGAYTRTEADRTIRSGLTRGATRPRRITDHPTRTNTGTRTSRDPKEAA